MTQAAGIRMAKPPTSDVAFSGRFVSREQGERYRDRYAGGRHARMNQIERAAIRALLHDQGRIGEVIDIPCGVGRLSALVAEGAQRLIAADSSPVMLELAREELKNRPAEYLCTDIENIHLPDRSVDLVFCHRLLHHIYERPTRARIIAELARVSRRFVLVSYFTPSVRTRIRWWLGLLTGKSNSNNRPAGRRQFLSETRAAGLKWVRSQLLRRFPVRAEFCLFERVPA